MYNHIPCQIYLVLGTVTMSQTFGGVLEGVLEVACNLVLCLANISFLVPLSLFHQYFVWKGAWKGVYSPIFLFLFFPNFPIRRLRRGPYPLFSITSHSRRFWRGSVFWFCIWHFPFQGPLSFLHWHFVSKGAWKGVYSPMISLLH